MTRQDLPALSARLAAWVRLGDDPADRPRLDRAIEAYRAAAPKPPAWWFSPNDMPADVDPADYWPMVGELRGQQTGGWGAGSVAAAEAAIAGRAIDEPKPHARAKVTVRDILDNAFLGDSIASIARRLGVDPKGLRQRLQNNPGIAARVHEKRGAITTGGAL